MVDSFSDLVQQKRLAEVSSDMHFMQSVAADMKLIPAKKKIKFKAELRQLIANYIEAEDP